MSKVSFNVKGMDCDGCARTITNVLSKMMGIKSAKVDYSSGRAEVEYNEKDVKESDIEKKIQQLGYKTSKA
ncbi:MAG TPA: heavy metal-associated domain-containing protein [Candidatus Norongarragalinales archaeon]|jgi:copper chaperone CopZ|nr:heavy metal-associated domain-containing protein [Candidatus Norongarragalinales archaeon]